MTFSDIGIPFLFLPLLSSLIVYNTATGTPSNFNYADLMGSFGCQIFHNPSRNCPKPIVSFIQTDLKQSTSIAGPVLYDNFESGIYDLPNEAKSQNGKWYSIDNGYGAMGVKTEGGNNFFFLKPKEAERRNETFSSLVRTVNNFSNFKLTMDVRTDKQLRLNSLPNDWEVAWVLFRYTDVFHFYWLLLKPDGVEFGKKDCNNCTDPVQGQVFLKRLHSPILKIGNWSSWNITGIGNHILIDIDGRHMIDFTDKNSSRTLNKGSVALYSEDAQASFDNIYITRPGLRC